MRLAIIAGDALFQGNAFPVAHRIFIEHPVRGRDGPFGRAGGRLAELHVDDIPALGGQIVCDAADGDRVELLDPGDLRHTSPSLASSPTSFAGSGSSMPVPSSR